MRKNGKHGLRISKTGEIHKQPVLIPDFHMHLPYSSVSKSAELLEEKKNGKHGLRISRISESSKLMSLTRDCHMLPPSKLTNRELQFLDLMLLVKIQIL